MRFENLTDWLSWQENLHFTEVDPGLERIGQVWEALGGVKQLYCKVITVAGTNGKGSSVAMLDAILRTAGYRTGTYTSPHLLRYNERICVDGKQCDDGVICEAFDQIDQARNGISLTYFEFATLAAVSIFGDSQLDVVIFEVGMGGRLDAVNLFDADIALLTPVSLDHMHWLGNDIETIAKEKAGILRRNRPVVCAEANPANTVIEHAQSLNAPLYIANQDFSSSIHDEKWDWRSENIKWENLPQPALQGHYQYQNAAAVLQVLHLLNQQGFNITQHATAIGLRQVRLAGRFHVINRENAQLILDVTHNEQGAINLAQLLSENDISGKTIAVLAILKDKDVTAVVEPLSSCIDEWYVAGLNGNRGMSGESLAEKMLPYASQNMIKVFDTVDEAYIQANELAENTDRLLIFGSFHTVEAVMKLNPDSFK